MKLSVMVQQLIVEHSDVEMDQRMSYLVLRQVILVLALAGLPLKEGMIFVCLVN